MLYLKVMTLVILLGYLFYTQPVRRVAEKTVPAINATWLTVALIIFTLGVLVDALGGRLDGIGLGIESVETTCLWGWAFLMRQYERRNPAVRAYRRACVWYAVLLTISLGFSILYWITK